MSGLPVFTVRPGPRGKGWRVRLGNPRRWVWADVAPDGTVVAWDVPVLPAAGQGFEVLESREVSAADGRRLVVVRSVRLGARPSRCEWLPVGIGATARFSDPETSKAAGAAKAANPERLSVHQERVLRDHARHHVDGLTDFELAASCGLQQTSAGKRRLELVRAGLIEATGSVRLSPSNTPAKVWRITPTGWSVAFQLELAGAA